MIPPSQRENPKPTRQVSPKSHPEIQGFTGGPTTHWTPLGKRREKVDQKGLWSSFSGMTTSKTPPSLDLHRSHLHQAPSLQMGHQRVARPSLRHSLDQLRHPTQSRNHETMIPRKIPRDHERKARAATSARNVDKAGRIQTGLSIIRANPKRPATLHLSQHRRNQSPEPSHQGPRRSLILNSLGLGGLHGRLRRKTAALLSHPAVP